jgi:hypothetical protein
MRPKILDNIRVATPCHAKWDEMTGDERARLCRECNRTVYNISALTREEAEDLVIEKEGMLCVQYFERADGTILLADCEVGRQPRRRHRLLAAAATLATSAGLIACDAGEVDKVEVERVEVKKADIVVDTPTVEVPRREHARLGGPPPPPSDEQLREYRELKNQRAKRHHR